MSRNIGEAPKVTLCLGYGGRPPGSIPSAAPARRRDVTNGGWNGTLAAIEAGIRLVVAGGSLDKPEVSRRVAWSGAGIDLRTGSPKPARIARAVEAVAGRPPHPARARELGTALTAAGGAVATADLLEALLAR